jgi:hypothetical protein
MEQIPRIKTVDIIGTFQLLVHFDNGEQRIYDCRPLLNRPQFHLLENQAFSRSVRVDPGGYGISWNDDIDISEYELWINGKAINDNEL